MKKSKKKELEVEVEMEGPEDEKDEPDHEAEEAMRDMMRAEEHKGKPHLMKRVHAIAGRHMKALESIKSIQGLKDLYNEKYSRPQKDFMTDGEMVKPKKKKG